MTAIIRDLYYHLVNFFSTLLLLLWTVYCTLVATIFGFLPNSMVAFFLRWWSRICLFLIGVRVNVVGKENLPDEGAVYLFNHQSLLDIPIVLASLPVPVNFGAKIELYKIPLWGFIMRRFGVLPIARNDQREVQKVYDKAVARIHNGENVILAPEGTRAPLNKLLEFKSGPFIFAIQAQAPLVPLAIKGAGPLMPKKKLLVRWQEDRKVTIEILPWQSTKGLKLEDRKRLKEEMREKFAAALNY